MICARCDQPIGLDEEAQPVDHMSPTGPGMTVYIHAELCRRVQVQTAPVERWVDDFI